MRGEWARHRPLRSAIESAWGSFGDWLADFVRTGMTRGIGWAILYQDPASRAALSNMWIGDHEIGHPAGFNPVLVMDAWEHAYVLQFGALGRRAYIDAFFENVDWAVVGNRLA